REGVSEVLHDLRPGLPMKVVELLLERLLLVLAQPPLGEGRVIGAGELAQLLARLLPGGGLLLAARLVADALALAGQGLAQDAAEPGMLADLVGRGALQPGPAQSGRVRRRLGRWSLGSSPVRRLDLFGHLEDSRR